MPAPLLPILGRLLAAGGARGGAASLAKAMAGRGGILRGMASDIAAEGATEALSALLSGQSGRSQAGSEPQEGNRTQARAPKGGITIDGKRYAGGQLLPRGFGPAPRPGQQSTQASQSGALQGSLARAASSRFPGARSILGGAALGGLAGTLGPAYSPINYAFQTARSPVVAAQAGQQFLGSIAPPAARQVFQGSASAARQVLTSPFRAGGFADLARAAARGPAILESWGQALLDSRRNLGQFDSTIANTIALAEFRDIQRGIRSGRATGGTTSAMSSALSDLKDELRPLRDAMTNAANRIVTVGLRLTTVALETAEKGLAAGSLVAAAFGGGPVRLIADRLGRLLGEAPGLDADRPPVELFRAIRDRPFDVGRDRDADGEAAPRKINRRPPPRRRRRP